MLGNAKKGFVLAGLLSLSLLASGCSMVRTNDDETTTVNQEDTTQAVGDININNESTELDLNEDIFGNRGNSQAGMVSGEAVTLYGGYYLFNEIINGRYTRCFYIDGEEKVHLFCFDETCNHTEETCTAFGSYANIQYYKGNLYYRDTNKIFELSEGTKEVVYQNNSFIDDFSIRDDKFFFFDDGGICFVDMNTKEKTYLTDMMACVFSLNVYNDVIYFCSEAFQLYKMNLDGTGLELLTDDFAFSPQYHNGKLYYRKLEKAIEESSLVELDLETGEKKTIDENVYQLRVCEDAVYYMDWTGGDYCNLYKYNYEKQEITKIAETKYNNFAVYDELDYIVLYDVFYFEDELGNIIEQYVPFLVDKDGKNRRELEIPEIVEVLKQNE